MNPRSFIIKYINTKTGEVEYPHSCAGGCGGSYTLTTNKDNARRIDYYGDVKLTSKRIAHTIFCDINCPTGLFASVIRYNWDVEEVDVKEDEKDIELRNSIVDEVSKILIEKKFKQFGDDK